MKTNDPIVFKDLEIRKLKSPKETDKKYKSKEEVNQRRDVSI